VAVFTEAQGDSLTVRDDVMDGETEPGVLVELTLRCVSVRAVSPDDSMSAHAQLVLFNHDHWTDVEVMIGRIGERVSAHELKERVHLARSGDNVAHGPSNSGGFG
jgi:hypothetical protein